MAEEDKRLSLKLQLENECLSHTHEQDVYGLVTLKAPFFEPIQRAPLRMVLVLDVSGSMEGEKIELVKESVLFSVDQLKACDSLAVVSFGTQVTTVLEMTAMDESGRDVAKKAVKGLKAWGCTNLSGGLLKAVQVLQDGSAENDVAGMLLFTDGQANQGLTNAPAIIRAVEGASTRKNLTLSCFGFGTDHDSVLLRSLSDSGNGMYYFLNTHDTIPTAFADCLGGLLSVACQNCELVVEMGGAEGTKILQVYGQTTAKLADDGRQFKIDLSDLQSEQRRDILFRFLLPTLPAPDTNTTLTATVTYFNVPTSTQHTEKQIVCVARPVSNDPPGVKEEEGRDEVKAEIDVQRNRVAASEAMGQADTAAAGGDCAKATGTLQAAIASIKASRTASADESKDLVAELEQSLKSVQSREHYLSGGSHTLRGKTQMLTKQWANEIYEGDGPSITTRYTSTHKTHMVNTMRQSMMSVRPSSPDPSGPAVQTQAPMQMQMGGGLGAGSMPAGAINQRPPLQFDADSTGTGFAMVDFSNVGNVANVRNLVGVGGAGSWNFDNVGNMPPMDNVGNLGGGALGSISEGEEEQNAGGAQKRENSDGEGEANKHPKLD